MGAGYSGKNSPQLIFHMLDMPLNGIKLGKNAFSLVLSSLTLHEKQTSQMSRLQLSLEAQHRGQQGATGARDKGDDLSRIVNPRVECYAT